MDIEKVAYLDKCCVTFSHAPSLSGASLPLFIKFPAIFAGGDALKDLWVFICAPLVGGALAALVWKGMVPKEK